MFDRRAFAAQRSDQMDRGDDLLRSAVTSGLTAYARGEQGWTDPIMAAVSDLWDTFSDTGEDPEFAAQVEATLAKTTKPSDPPSEDQVETVTRWLSTATINAAAVIEAASYEGMDDAKVVWTSMRDDHVRDTHQVADGQVREQGDPFQVGAATLRYPGDPLGPPEEVLNCRCVLVVEPSTESSSETLTFAEGDEPSTAIVAALPADDDPVRSLGPEDKHATVIFMGDVSTLDLDAISAAVAKFAATARPVTSQVSGLDTLGDDEAQVAMLDDALVPLHDSLLADPAIKAGYDNAEMQYPSYTPHVTIGYPTDDYDPESIEAPEYIRFDRLALWSGDDQQEFALGGDDMPEDQTVTAPPEVDGIADPVPWHGVLAPEGVMSGDGRQFADGSLRFRDLPIPLRYVDEDNGGHDGARIVARIDEIHREDGLMKASGVFDTSQVSNDVISQIANGFLRGVSVDVDDATFEMQWADGTPAQDPLEILFAEGDDEHEGEEPIMVVTDGRIAAATIVAIPAFQEAFVALGPWEGADASDPGEPDAPPPLAVGDAVVWSDSDGDHTGILKDIDADRATVTDDATGQDVPVALSDLTPAPPKDVPPETDDTAALFADESVSNKPWSDFTQADYDDDQWKRACVLDKGGDGSAKQRYGLPIREPDGTLNSNGVHAAAARFNQVDASPEAKSKAASALRGAYSTLGEDPPDVLASAGETAEFAPGTHDGPGWITNPQDTQRLRDYWVHGEGAAKIRWGEPNDFYRCESELGKYVHRPEWLAGTCSNLHKVALGVWPGQEDATASAEGEMAPAMSLVASAAAPLPAAWFADPGLDAPTPLTVTEDGRVFGHLAAWGTCHVGMAGVCTTPPHSKSGYAYFRTGAVDTDEGEVAVGQITLGTGHCPITRGSAEAMAHYDNTGSAVADVAVGEDSHGIWFAGALRHGVTAEQVATLKAASLSGDWRVFGRRDQELVAALAVNVPGFPVPRMQVGVKAGRQTALVASGVVPPYTLDAGTMSVALKVTESSVAVFADAVMAAIDRRHRARDAKAALRRERALAARAKITSL